MTSPEEQMHDPEERREKAAAYIRERRKTKRLRRKKRKRHVLTLPCPSFTCQKPIQLLCPYCHYGALDVDEHNLSLSCNHCHNTLHQLPCGHCGFILRPSYIYEKQRNLRQLRESADGSKFLAIIITFALGIFGMWSIINLYG